MINELPLACVLFDKEMNIVKVNQEAHSLLECAYASDSPAHFAAFFPELQPDGGKTHDIVAEGFRTAVRAGESKLSLMLNTLGGKQVLTEIVLRRVEAGQDTFILCSVFDMRSLSHMFDMVDQLEKLAYTDPLTGAYNRRYFIEEAEQELRACVASHKPFCLIMADIDHFKSVNDTFGHSSGDEVLKIFVSRIRGVLRDCIVARLGGEEFVVMLAGTDISSAEKIAWRIQEHIESSPFYFTIPDKDEKVEIGVTASFGVASMPESHVSIYTVLEHADEAMYKAKSSGRNTVVMYAPN